MMTMCMNKQTGRWLVGLGLFFLLMLTAFGIQAQEQGFTLTILHTNDVHAHLLPFNQAGGDCSDEEAQAGKCFGGVARQYALIQQIRQKEQNVVLLDAGDQFQGTLFFNEYKGKAAQQFMNEFHYQAMTLGNHEFDDGVPVLTGFLSGLKFPVVSANINVSHEPALNGLIKPYTILTIANERIGVIGCTTIETPSMSSPGASIIFNDVKESVAKAVGELEQQGINKIIVLSHIGYAQDQALAAAVKGIDVIVGGHSHTYLSSTPATKNIDQSMGDYPTVVKSPAGDSVLVVQVFWMGKYLGNLGVTFDAQGKLTAWDGKPMLLDAQIIEDEKIIAEVEQLNKPLDGLRKKVIGSTAVDLVGDRNVCRFAECNLGNLITDAMVAKTSHLKTQIAILNGGSIRASILQGDVTLGTVLMVMPFGNTLATFGLKGADVLAALEHGVSRAENPQNDGTGRFPQVSGMRYWWDDSKPVGSRIAKVEVRNEGGNYEPLDKDKVYQVVAIDYARRGGDGYDVFAKKAINPSDDSGYLSDSAVEYITAHSPVSANLEGRITRGIPETFPLIEYGRYAIIYLPLATLILMLLLLWSGVFRKEQNADEGVKEHE